MFPLVWWGYYRRMILLLPHTVDFVCFCVRDCVCMNVCILTSICTHLCVRDLDVDMTIPLCTALEKLISYLGTDPDALEKIVAPGGTLSEYMNKDLIGHIVGRMRDDWFYSSTEFMIECVFLDRMRFSSSLGCILLDHLFGYCFYPSIFIFVFEY